MSFHDVNSVYIYINWGPLCVPTTLLKNGIVIKSIREIKVFQFLFLFSNNNDRTRNPQNWVSIEKATHNFMSNVASSPERSTRKAYKYIALCGRNEKIVCSFLTFSFNVFKKKKKKKKLKFHQRNSNNKNKLQFPQPIKPRNPFSFISRFVFFFFSLFQPLVFFLGYRAIQCAAVVCSLREKRSRRNHKELVKKMTKTLNIETKCYNWILIRWRFFFCRTIFFFFSSWMTKENGKEKESELIKMDLIKFYLFGFRNAM